MSVDKMSSAKSLEANWSHIHMHKLIYGGYASLSFLNSEGFPASSVSLELRTRRCNLTTEKPGLYCRHLLSLRKDKQVWQHFKTGSKFLLHTELNFVKSYYTLVNSYYTFSVPKHTILGPGVNQQNTISVCQKNQLQQFT